MARRTNEREVLARGAEVIEALASTRIVVCGAGALGANLVESLVRMGAGHVRVIDFDRIEQHNLSTQPWSLLEVGQFKADMLAASLFRGLDAEVEAEVERLDEGNAVALLEGADVVVDAFDNSASRELVQRVARAEGLECLHMGLADGYAEVIWDDVYEVPSDEGLDVCDYPLTRSAVLMCVALGVEALLAKLVRGEQRSFCVTMGDLVVSEFGER